MHVEFSESFPDYSIFIFKFKTQDDYCYNYDYCYNLHLFILWDVCSTVENYFRKSSAPIPPTLSWENPPLLHFYSTLPRKLQNVQSSPFLPTLKIFRALLQKGVVMWGGEGGVEDTMLCLVRMVSCFTILV